MDLVRKLVAERGLEPPKIEKVEPFDARVPARLDLSGFGAVIFAGGFRPGYRSWLPWAEPSTTSASPSSVTARAAW
jgi:hypothetical protein